MYKLVLVTLVIGALGLAGCSRSGTPATEVVQVAGVDADGQPANGYREGPSPSNMIDVSFCDASPAAVDDDIYACSPSAAGADVCWPATGDELLCVDAPWDKQLYRVTVTDELPQVAPPDDPQPFALLLDDGTRCRLRNGGAWGGRDDGYVGAYGCESTSQVVLVQAGPDADVIDRTGRLWTVQVGELGEPDTHFPPPTTHTVRTAWFAAR